MMLDVVFCHVSVFVVYYATIGVTFSSLSLDVGALSVIEITHNTTNDFSVKRVRIDTYPGDRVPLYRCKQLTVSGHVLCRWTRSL